MSLSKTEDAGTGMMRTKIMFYDLWKTQSETMINLLVMAGLDLKASGIKIMFYDLAAYISPMKFIELSSNADVSPATREAMHEFLKVIGWNPDQSDPRMWGDFDRQYSYIQEYILESMSVISQRRNVFTAEVGDNRTSLKNIEEAVFVLEKEMGKKPVSSAATKQIAEAISQFIKLNLICAAIMESRASSQVNSQANS